jgi:hypothetical protein
MPLLSSLKVLFVSKVLSHFASYPEECVDVLTEMEVRLPKQSLP